MLIDDDFKRTKINPIVGEIFHSAKQLGLENAPASMDMECLRRGTEGIVRLLTEVIDEGGRATKPVKCERFVSGGTEFGINEHFPLCPECGKDEGDHTFDRDGDRIGSGRGYGGGQGVSGKGTR